jgi:hypothetical protein
MTKYREIKGTLIQNVSADPPASFEGQVWYNTTTNQLRLETGSLISAWSTGGDLNNPHYRTDGSGLQTSTLAMEGGPVPAGTESYNGTNWSIANGFSTDRMGLGSAGADNTSALGFGGHTGNDVNLGNTESFNGTSWSEVNDLNTARRYMNGCGTQTAALGSGGTLGPPPVSALTESWNGTNWTEVNDLNTARNLHAHMGSNTSGLVTGGVATATDNTELWNGTNWTEVNNLNTARNRLGGAGTQTSALVFSGFAIPDRTVTESWNGTNWTETSNLSVDRYSVGSAGADNTSAIAYGGIPSSLPGTATEEWNVTGPAVNITSS